MNEPNQGPVKVEIERKLLSALAPSRLRVVDESSLHAGHHGHRPGQETHFKVEVVSEHFAGLSRLARHRRVNELLSKELSEGVHALSIDAKSPSEVD